MGTKSFWTHSIEKRSIHDVKASHLMDRTLDSKMKWLGYKSIQTSGVVSNIFRIMLNSSTSIYRYAISSSYHKRCLRLDKWMPGASLPLRARALDEKSLYIQKINEQGAIRKHLLESGFNEPFIFANNCLFSTRMIPESVLCLPAFKLDVHTKKCRLNLIEGKAPVLDFPAHELQKFSNQIIKWCVKDHESAHGNYFLAKDTNSKIVNSQQGFSVNGLRIFQGIQAQMVYVENKGENEIELLKVLHPAPPSRVLESIDMTNNIETTKLSLQIMHEIPGAKSDGSSSYMVRDSSGSTVLTMFDSLSASHSPSFTIGSTYTLVGLRAKVQNRKFKKGNFDFFLIWGSRSKILEEERHPLQDRGGNQSRPLSPLKPSSPSKEKSICSQSIVDKFADTELGLRLDTLCTVASEKNLLDEILEEFGAAPYEQEHRSKISSFLHFLPVVDSISLGQSHVMDLCFPNQAESETTVQQIIERIDGGSSLPKRYLKHMHELSCSSQPVAILRDSTAVPIQFLHRSFDVQNNWQSTAVPACSILPSRRLAILQRFCRALSEGLGRWGMKVLPNPMITKKVEIVHSPSKVQVSSNAEDPRLSPPRKILIVAIRPLQKKSNDQKISKLENMVNLLSRDLSATGYHMVQSVPDALSLIESLKLQNICSACVFILEDYKSQKSVAPLLAASTQKGYIPIFCRFCQEKTSYSMWKAHVIRYMHFKTNGNPFTSLDFSKDVPSVKSRCVLILGVDACHTFEGTTGAVVGTLLHGPKKIPVIYPVFWSRCGASCPASEVLGVSDACDEIIKNVCRLLDRFKRGLDEIIVMQDGSVHSNMAEIESKVPLNVSFTYLNLHKRTNMRFISSNDGMDINCPRGCLVKDLTPIAEKKRAHRSSGKIDMATIDARPLSFFLQSHDCKMSTARTLQFVCHRLAPHWGLDELQKLCHVLSFAHSLLPSKLPFPAKCAHILAEKAHNAWLEDSNYACDKIPTYIRHRLWFL